MTATKEPPPATPGAPATAAVPSGVTRARMRQVLSAVPTSVSVVCTEDAGVPVGSTIGSFTSVSLEPPLVAFFAMDTSSATQTVLRRGRFTVNVLSEHQEAVCQRFATPGIDRFINTAWKWSREGLPLIDGALVTIECSVQSATRAGDHLAIMGRVDYLAEHGNSRPLTFQRGRLWSLGHRGPSFPDRTYSWWGE